MVLKATIIAGITAGSIAFGALTTYNGGAIVDLAQSKITKQAEELGIYKSQQTQLVEKLTATKDRLAYLEANGTDADQAEIDKLKAEAATLQTNIDTTSGETADRINALEAEVATANADAQELQTTIDTVGDTPEAMYQSQLDILTDSVPEGQMILKMINGTPQWVYDENGLSTGLKIDKTDADPKNANLVFISEGMQSFYITLPDGTEKYLASGETYNAGNVEDLDAKSITVKSAQLKVLGTYYLTVQ